MRRTLYGGRDIPRTSGCWIAEGQVQKHTHRDCAMVQGQGVREFVPTATGSFSIRCCCSRATMRMSVVRDIAVPVLAVGVCIQQQVKEDGINAVCR